MTTPHDDLGEQGPQPIFNVPILALVIAGSMPLLYWFQTGLPDLGASMALRPIDLQNGYWAGLLTSMLVHGGWMHVLMNAVAALAFGAPVARLFSRGFGPVAFLALYILSGVAGGLGFALLHMGSTVSVVGASGAVFGLIGASTRLLGPLGFVIPWNHPIVLRQAIGWMIANLAIGLISGTQALGGPAIAWEAHAFGFIFGFFAIGPLAKVMHRLS